MGFPGLFFEYFQPSQTILNEKTITDFSVIQTQMG